MLSFTEPTVYERSKCFFTYGRLAHLDPEQLPTSWKNKGKPWPSILGHDFVRRVDLILPQDSWQAVQEKLLEKTLLSPSHRVTMTLSQILEGDFFTEYIKIGDVMMLSQGRNDLDNAFTLKDGQLTMFLDKETYERAGLVGKPYGHKGTRGLKPRWVVEFDLRRPSMFRGKKGFDRLVYACKKVLSEPLTWLFCNVADRTPKPDPLEAFQPTKCTSSPQITEAIDAVVPQLKLGSDMISGTEAQDLPDFASEIYEWLSLVRLQSPRVSSTDNIDPYLSRYQIPGEPGQQTTSGLCTVTWDGFIPPSFARQLLVDTILALPSRAWFSVTVSSFSKGFSGDAAETTFLRQPGPPSEYLLWDIRSHE
ncbi:Ribonuclease P protein subunit p40 [Cytospora mali]|uniref:Ribonuclease P protein subunit p40 n=1 Tax=Cytospora mali TaxID=578113 RepID=A0A194VHN8_CYTMA|nr:Ribonuclease P protein subunit p40 [Valsa mali]